MYVKGACIKCDASRKPEADPVHRHTGTGSAVTLQLLHPLLRSRNRNLFVQASLDQRRFHDEVTAVGIDTRKGVTSYATFGVVGDWRDTWFGGGITLAG